MNQYILVAIIVVVAFLIYRNYDRMTYSEGFNPMRNTKSCSSGCDSTNKPLLCPGKCNTCPYNVYSSMLDKGRYAEAQNRFGLNKEGRFDQNYQMGNHHYDHYNLHNMNHNRLVRANF